MTLFVVGFRTFFHSGREKESLLGKVKADFSNLPSIHCQNSAVFTVDQGVCAD